jgi:hypothetical protein
MKRMILAGLLIGLGCITTLGWGQWQPHTVSLLNRKAGEIREPAKFQIVTNLPATANLFDPYLVYMPEKDRLLMLTTHLYPKRAAVITSNAK